VKSDEEARAWKEVFNKIDVGCGTGEISLLLASMGHQVTGLDLSDKIMEKGISYLLISHDIELLYQVCDRIAYLEAGRIVKMEKI